MSIPADLSLSDLLATVDRLMDPPVDASTLVRELHTALETVVSCHETEAQR